MIYSPPEAVIPSAPLPSASSHLETLPAESLQSNEKEREESGIRKDL
ncbi:MAG: hypothetical protein LBL71_04425 [Endomicrobium sp.]|nr:hypothetical protein [Endomicrobium sp.]